MVDSLVFLDMALQKFKQTCGIICVYFGFREEQATWDL